MLLTGEIAMGLGQRVWLCVGVIGVGLEEWVCAVCVGKFGVGLVGVNFCYEWDSVLWIWGSEFGLCVGQFGVDLW